MDKSVCYADVDRFYEDYFQQTIVKKQFVSRHNPYSRTLEFADGQKWVSKAIPPKNWIGVKRCREDIEFTEQVASQVSEYLNATVRAVHWAGGQAVVPYFKDWHLLFPLVKGVDVKQWQPLHAFELGTLLALMHSLPLPTKRAGVFPKLCGSGHFPASIQQDIDRCNEAFLHRQDEFVVSHRDFHVENIMWGMDNKPILIDWESAGFIHPFVDLIGLAVNAASINQLRFNGELFKSALSGYRTTQGSLPASDRLLWQQCLHSWLLWLSHNHRINHENEVENTLKIIKYLHEVMPVMQHLYHSI